MTLGFVLSNSFSRWFAAAVFLALCGCGNEAAKQAPSVAQRATQTSAAPTPAPQPQAVSNAIAAGTTVPLTLMETVDSARPFYASFVSGTVAENVMGSDGKLAIPAGANALLTVRVAGRNGPISVLYIAAYSVDIGGRQCQFVRNNKDSAFLTFSEDASKGPMHRSVHLQRGTVLNFKLSQNLQLL